MLTLIIVASLLAFFFLVSNLVWLFFYKRKLKEINSLQKEGTQLRFDEFDSRIKSTLSTEITDLKTKNTQFHEDIIKLRKENVELRNSNNDLLSENYHLKDTNTKLNNENIFLRKKIDKDFTFDLGNYGPTYDFEKIKSLNISLIQEFNTQILKCISQKKK